MLFHLQEIKNSPQRYCISIATTVIF